MQSPKHIYKPFKNRNFAIGKERRRNAVKKTLEYQPHCPKPVTYSDIDQSVFDWVNNNLSLNYDGKRLPTYKLFSNQRISEYGQNWKELDEKGNIETNFKTITRENNPQHGENQGNSYNIPSDLKYPIFQTKILDENGDEIIQVYTMKQPFAVNLIYSISIVTSSYSMLNKMNTMVIGEFKGLEKYIFPNGFAMPMLLNSISDESDYTIDDRKYYCQTYQLKVLGFIINEEDYEVQKVPSRPKSTFRSGENSSKKTSKPKYDINALNTSDYNLISYKNKEYCEDKYTIIEKEKEYNQINAYNPISGKTEIEVIDYDGLQMCYEDTEYPMYVNKKVIYNISLDVCTNTCDFVADRKLELETLEINNLKTYTLYINDIEINVEDSDVTIYEYDVVKIYYVIKDDLQKASIKFIFYDPNTIVSNDNDASSYNEEIDFE